MSPYPKLRGRRRLRAALAAAAALQAAEAPAEWLFAAAAQLDEESTESVLTTVDWGASDATWLSFAAGQSRASSEGADIRASTLGMGVDHRVGTFGMSLDVERWGDPDSIESFDLDASIYVERGRTHIALERIARDIDVHFTLTGPLGRTFERTAAVDADGIGVSASVEVGERWRVFGSRRDFDYDRNLTLLPRIDRLNLLGASALTLADSFVERMTSLGFEWAGDEHLLTLYLSRDRSAVDRAQLDGVNAAMLFPVGERLDLELNLGRSRSDALGSGLYGGVLLLYYGGE
jgi:hypothetical protein